MAYARPFDLTATAISATRIDLEWKNGAIYEMVEVSRQPLGGAYAVVETLDGDVTDWSDTDCEDGTVYYYRVRGYLFKTYTAYSVAATAFLGTPVAPPTNLAAVAASTTQINLTWSIPFTYSDNVLVERRGEGEEFALIEEMAGWHTSTHDTDCEVNTKYFYRIRGKDSGTCSAYTAEVNAWSCPEAVVDLEAVKDTLTHITLSWTQPVLPGYPAGRSAYALTQLERKAGGGAYAKIYETTSSAGSFVYGDTVLDGETYLYRVRGKALSGVFSLYSNVAVVIVGLVAPTNLAGNSEAVGTQVTLTWEDNSAGESNFNVEMKAPGGVYTVIHQTAPGVESYTKTGLTPQLTYWFRIRAVDETHLPSWLYSSYSNAVSVFMSDIPDGRPTNLTATTISTSEIRLDWKRNSTNETGFEIEQSAVSGVAGFVKIFTTKANVKTYTVTGLVSAGAYWFRVRAKNQSGCSGYSNVATTTTFADIAPPTNVVATPISATVCEVTFQDNSTKEDDHSVEVNDNGAGFIEIGQLAPNRTYFCVSMEAGHTYLIRLRARQTASFSAYSNEAAYAPLVALDAPTNLAVSEYQDTWVKLTWAKTAGELGYRIEKSVDDGATYTEVVVIFGAGIEALKISGLLAGTHYHFRVCAYNGAGNSAYSNNVGQTTRAVYAPSKFEKLIRSAKPLLFLVEVNPLMEITGWSLTAGQTYTYEAAFDERGAALHGVFENGVALAGKTSIATVEAVAGSWWHDASAKKVYVHTSLGGDPTSLTITGDFWMYFTSRQAGPTIFNGNFYFPLIATDGIPDISQAVQPYYEGTFAISSGSVSLINGKIKQFGHFFDRLFSRYFWLSRKGKILAGAEGFTYAEFRAINSGMINSVNITDQRFELSLRDLRDGIHRDLPTDKYSLAIFPNMETNKKEVERPLAFGSIVNAIPVCIDTVNRVFEFTNGRAKAVALTRDGTELLIDVDYFVDYQRGRFTLARDLTYVAEDTLLVSFTACLNICDDTAANGADAFRYICNTFLGLDDSDLDLDAIYATKIAKPVPLSLYLRTARNSQDIIRTIEQSIQAYSSQDEEGRIGLRAEQAVVASGAPYVWDLHVYDFQSGRDPASLFSEVNVYYGEDYSAEKFSLSQTLVPTMTWKHGVRKALDVFVALTSAVAAEAIGTAVVGLMARQKVKFSVPGILFTTNPGDVIYFNRTRFPSLSGTAMNVPVRILGITKLISSGRTEIEAEVV